eukprot:TRINITY_DN4679_c0_g2_i1.p1 TRINITY_DN4679_c0_g2~~TRINITY_DN4679_c0_g2_i1.p1  ORF type:complete len:600 (+),score=172.51 TRINITY_DN4679_c0_g2_i1:166-1965(+)
MLTCHLIKDQCKRKKHKKTDEWVVQVHDGVDPNILAREHGYRNMGRIGSLKDYFLFKKLNVRGEFPHIGSSQKIKFQEQQVKRKRYTRANLTIKDPLYAKQWHFHQQPKNVTLQTMELWKQGILGEGVTIAIVDDGLETNHPDIAPNYNAQGSWDFNFNDNDPYPARHDSHGTSSAGCAAAPFNSVCGVGVAPKAKVSGIRLIALEATDAQEAAALSYKTQINHIFTNSWGPFDDGKRYEGAGPALTAAMEQSVKEGRGGKGTIYVWASGNGRRANDNCNYDGYSNHRYTITIGAVTEAGSYAFYSEPCSSIFASAPSSGSGNGIITADLMGRRGNNPTDCNLNFGGTSAAAPLAAGMISLMLGVNPNLTWRDVQHILANSSSSVDIRNTDWWSNEAGYRHNHNYGFGLINPEKAVELSKSWKTVPPYLSISFKNRKTGKIPQIVGKELILQFESTNSTIDFIEHIEVNLKITHERKGQLRIYLLNDFGTVSHLSVPHKDNSDFPEKGWTYGSVRHWGEKVNQKWQIHISDSVKDDAEGVLSYAGITFYGHSTKGSTTSHFVPIRAVSPETKTTNTPSPGEGAQNASSPKITVNSNNLL